MVYKILRVTLSYITKPRAHNSHLCTWYKNLSSINKRNTTISSTRDFFPFPISFSLDPVALVVSIALYFSLSCAAVDPALWLEQSSLGFVLWKRALGAFFHGGAEQLVVLCRAPYDHWIREHKADQCLFDYEWISYVRQWWKEFKSKTYFLLKLNSNYIFSLGFSCSQYFDLVYFLL